MVKITALVLGTLAALTLGQDNPNGNCTGVICGPHCCIPGAQECGKDPVGLDVCVDAHAAPSTETVTGTPPATTPAESSGTVVTTVISTPVTTVSTLAPGGNSSEVSVSTVISTVTHLNGTTTAPASTTEVHKTETQKETPSASTEAKKKGAAATMTPAGGVLGLAVAAVLGAV